MTVQIPWEDSVPYSGVVGEMGTVDHPIIFVHGNGQMQVIGDGIFQGFLILALITLNYGPLALIIRF